MNLQELKDALVKHQIDPRRVGFGGPEVADDQWRIERQVTGWADWVVYYTERGRKREQKDFMSEEDACNYLFAKLIDNLTTRPQRKE
jgi:hypothetical protein